MKKYFSFIQENNSDSSKEEEMIKFMDSLLEGVHKQLGSKKYPHILFFVKDNQTIIYQETENGLLWVNYDKIWLFLEKDFQLNYDDTQEFMRMYVALRYNLIGVTPALLHDTFFEGLHLDSI